MSLLRVKSGTNATSGGQTRHRLSYTTGRRLLGVAWGRCVSFQITVLKVLAGSPGGRLPLANLRHDVALLISSGRDWTDPTKRIAARAPDLDIFSQAFVLREPTGWVITVAGRDFLAVVERPAAAAPVAAEAVPLASTVEVAPVIVDPPVAAPGLPLIGLNTPPPPTFREGRALRRLIGRRSCRASRNLVGTNLPR
jgi:hypothetical protein